MINTEPIKKIKKPKKTEPSIEELIKMAQNKDTDISSPTNKEFIIPLTFDNNTIRNPIFLPKKKHKTHPNKKKKRGGELR